jgi:hypothetical protein
MAYPTNTDTFTTKVDGVDSYLAAHMNAVQTAIVAVETELGTGLKGTQATLAARLAVGLNNDGTLKTAGITSLPANAVDTNAIQAQAVTAAKIANLTITAAQIANNTITATQIANGAIGALQIASGAVGTTQLADGGVVGVKLAAGLRAAHEEFQSVAAKGAATVFPLTATDAALHTVGLTNPDVPRVASVSLKNITGGALTSNNENATIIGTDASGQTITDVVNIPSQSIGGGVTVTVNGVKAFATVTSVQLSDAQNANWQFSVGTTDLIGLARTVAAVFKLAKNGADVAVIPTVDTTNGTINLATITATDNYGVWYRSA